MQNYEVAIIGGGPAGYVAAIRAAQLGKKVVLIEREHVGGICLNWGCIPTKALLKSAEIYNIVKNASQYGIDVERSQLNLAKMVERSRSIATQLASGVKFLLKKNQVTVIEGVGSLESNKIINIINATQTTKIQAASIILATGAKARMLNKFMPDSNQIWTAREAMTPTSLPKSLIIIGGGSIGIEFASFYNNLGTEVIIIEAQNRILSVEDEEISAIVSKIFTKKGIKIYTNANALEYTKKQDYIYAQVQIDKKLHSLSAEKILVAAGITPNTENLGLEKTNIKTNKGFIETNQFMQTAEPNIYAIGDVAGSPWLAHKASHEGIIAAEAIAGIKTHPIIKSNIPSCTYSSPQVASVGLTEAAAREAGYEIKVGRFPSIANGKALVINDHEGLIKTIFEAKTGELLGAHLVGAEVTELIHSFVIAKTLETTHQELINSIFPHPTLSEMLHESVLQAYGRAIHI